MTESKTKTAPKAMPNMATITIGYQDYVLPIDEATKIVKALEYAERYEYRYMNDVNDDGPAHFVWPEKLRLNMNLISYDDYIAGKITGKYDPA